VEKYCRAGQATDGNMARAHWMPDNEGLQLNNKLSKNNRFSTTTMLTETCLNAT
jgi:hypothetical protein